MADVHLQAPPPNGFATLLAGVIEAAAAADPAVARLLERSRGLVQIDVLDRGEVVGLKLVPGSLTVTSRPVAGADVRLAATAQDLQALGRVPLRWGLPDPLAAAGRRALADVLAGRLRVRPGTLAALRLLRTTTRLLQTGAAP